MQFNIQQLPFDSDKKIIDKMIPIFIGQSQRLIKEKPTFIDNDYTIIQLPIKDNSNIKESSIKAKITYWKYYTEEITYINNANDTIKIPLNVSIENQIDNGIFVVYDNLNNLLFSSNITKYNYTLTELESIELSKALILTGTLKCRIIYKYNDYLDFTYDNSTKQIFLIYTDKVNLISLKSVIAEQSYVTYIENISKTSYVIYDEITEDIIKNEYNTNIQIGLSKSSQAILISIENEYYINEVIQILKTLNYGYYIVPINLIKSNIDLLINYVKDENDNNYKSIIIPPSLPETKTLSLNNTFVKG